MGMSRGRVEMPPSVAFALGKLAGTLGRAGYPGAAVHIDGGRVSRVSLFDGQGGHYYVESADGDLYELVTLDG